MATDDERQTQDVVTGLHARVPSPGDAEQPPAADVHAYIGRQLRAVYDDVAKQPIPDRFLELMRQLETAQAE